MSRQLLRQARVVLVYKGIGYTFNALSSFSSETTYSEVSGKRKTLFSRTPKKYSIVNRQNSSSVTLEVLLTDSMIEALFFELVGLTKSGCSYRLPDSIAETPELFSMYLVNTDNTLEFTPCFVESIDIALTKNSALTANVSINAARRDIVNNNPLVREHAAGNPWPVSPVELKLGNTLYNNVTSVGISVQQTCSWREDKSYFDQADIYTPSLAYTSDILVGVSVAMNLDTKNQRHLPDFSNFVTSKTGFSMTIENARLIPRVTPAEVYNNFIDISPTEESGNTTFTFGE